MNQICFDCLDLKLNFFFSREIQKMDSIFETVSIIHLHFDTLHEEGELNYNSEFHGFRSR
jgi:hypothetical protein